MIDETKYKEILDRGLLLDHYFLLCNIKNGVKLNPSKRIQGFINLMTKKGYIEDDQITDKGLALVENCEYAQPVHTSTSTEVVDLGTWVQGLHNRCQDKLVELTGKKQVRDKIGAKDWPFLPSPRDLAIHINRFIRSYKINDYDKIEKCIMNHIESCGKANRWFPNVGYYVMKGQTSQMATDMKDLEEGEESVTIYKPTQKLL